VIRSAARDIDRYAVDSSNLKSVGYDESRQTLAVEFASGNVYHYAGVPTEVFEELSLSKSLGQFYAKNIKGKFASTVMTGICPTCLKLGYIGESCETPECSGTVLEVDRQHKQR